MDGTGNLCRGDMCGEREGWGHMYRLGLGLACIGVLVLSLFGNAMLWTVVCRSRWPQSAMNYFVLSLAAGDMALGAVLVPVLLGELWGMASSLATIVSMCTWTLLTVLAIGAMQGFVFVLVALDGFFAISQPIRTAITSSNARRLLWMVWGSSFLIAVPMVAFAQSPEGYSQGDTHAFTSWCLLSPPDYLYATYTCCTFLAPVAFASTTYVYLFIQYCRKRLENVPLSQAGKARWHKKLMWVGISFAHAVAWTPFHASVCAPLFGSTFPPSVTPTLLLLGYSMSLLRPLLYYCLNLSFRQGCKEVLYAPPSPCRSDVYIVTNPAIPGLRTSVGTFQLSCSGKPNRVSPQVLSRGCSGGGESHSTFRLGRPLGMYDGLLDSDINDTAPEEDVLTDSENSTFESKVPFPYKRATLLSRTDIFLGNRNIGITPDNCKSCNSGATALPPSSCCNEPFKGSGILQVSHLPNRKRKPRQGECDNTLTTSLTIVKSVNSEQERDSPHVNIMDASSRKKTHSDTSDCSRRTYDNQDQQQNRKNSHETGLRVSDVPQHRHSWPRIDAGSTEDIGSFPQRYLTPLRRYIRLNRIKSVSFEALDSSYFSKDVK